MGGWEKVVDVGLERQTEPNVPRTRLTSRPIPSRRPRGTGLATPRQVSGPVHRMSAHSSHPCRGASPGQCKPQKITDTTLTASGLRQYPSIVYMRLRKRFDMAGRALKLPRHRVSRVDELSPSLRGVCSLLAWTGSRLPVR
jgi:hypothetical protein